MILLFLLLCPLALGLVALCARHWARPIALAAVLINCVETIYAWGSGASVFRAAWLPEWGAQLHLELDGLSFTLVLVAHVMALLAIIGSWHQIHEKSGLFFGNLLWLLAGVIGVLMSFDLLLFFIFWELMIIPIYMCTTLCGGHHRVFASVQFLIFTQASGLIMLVSILGLYFVHQSQTGIYTFDLHALLHTELQASTELMILLGFLTAFLVKLPAFGFHVWLPALFEASPLGIILLGIMVKTGAYGILRFALPLFPHACVLVAPSMLALGAIGVIYGAVLAFSQTDIRKILAYATISHMGVVLMALFSGEVLAYNGAVILLVTEALSTGGLLLLLGRLKEFDLLQQGGLWTQVPKVGVVGLFFIMSSVGLPFLGNFVGEWMALVGIFTANKIAAGIVALGLVLSAVYYLRLIQKLFFGPCVGANPGKIALTELSSAQVLLFGSLITLLLAIGLYPQPLLVIIAQTNSVPRVVPYD